MLGFFVAPVQGRPGSPQEEGNDVGAADWVVLPRASASASASMEMCSEEAAKYVWEGAIPLQIHLHESEVTTLPATPPALVLGSRIGYLPLLIPLIKPHFYSTLPPGVDTVWFDYKGLPLKWYIPTGVLFDLLCPEPERPWNLTVHFRGYPAESLTPCDGEESVKWSFINSLKEATYIINGNCKSIMNMSQADQFELWQSVLKGTLDSYCKVSSRLKFGVLREDCKVRINLQSHQGINETNTIPNQTGRIPVRLYIRNVEDADNLEDIDMIDCWEKISYINRPVGNHDEGNLFTLRHAMESLLPDCFELPSLVCNSKLATEVGEDEHNLKPTDSETITGAQSPGVEESSDANLHEQHSTQKAKIKLIRIQGITPDWEVPFAWVVNNLMNPDYFLHISLFVSVSSPGVL